METNKKPYSKPNGVQLAFTSDLASCTIIRGQLYINMKSGKQWNAIPEVLGTLLPSCIQNEASKKPLYSALAKFRVAFASKQNQKELQQFVGSPLVLKYTSGSGQQRILGDKENPLYMLLSEPEGFDGYEITLSGTQKHPECFI